MVSSIFLGFSATVEQVLVEFCVNLLAAIAGQWHLGRRQLEWPVVVKQKRLRKKLETIRFFAFLDDSTMLKNLTLT